MGVIGVYEKVCGRSGDASANDERSYTKTWIVETDDPDTGVIEVTSAPGIPQRGETYAVGKEYDNGAVVQRLTAKQHPLSPTLWEVTATFQSRTGTVPTYQNKNPLLRWPQVRWSTAQYSRRIDKDRHGGAILNSAGQPFDEPLEVDQSRIVLQVTRNEAVSPAAKACYYADAINSDTFAGVGPGYAKVAAIGGNLQWESDVKYWSVTYEVHFHPEGFKRKILDQGTRYRNKKGKIVVGVDDNGMPLGHAVLLNGAGGRLDEGKKPVWRTYDVYQELPFGGLGLNGYL